MPDSPPSSNAATPDGAGDGTGDVPPAPDRTATSGADPDPASATASTGRDHATPTGQLGETAPDLTRRDDSTTSSGSRRTPLPSEVVVRARGLTHVYDDRHGLHDVDLDVPSGQILGIVGPSGSGKTTLVRLMLGLLDAHEGSIEVLGIDPAEAERHHHTRIGYLPQGNALDPDLSIRHNLDFMASLQGLPWRARWWPGKGSSTARQRVDDVLDLVDLEAEQSTLLRRASGGEQRRVALAAAIVHDPELLVLDEPTAGIDPVLRAQLWEYMTRLRDDGHTLVITTQYVTEADECDLVALMVDGRIIRVADPDGLRREAYGGHLLDVEHDTIDPLEVDLRSVDGVVGIQRRIGPRRVRFLVDNGDNLQARISDRFTERGAEPPLVSAHRPSFDEVFVRLVQEHRRNQGDDRRAAQAARA